MFVNDENNYINDGLELIYFDRKEEWKNAVSRANPVDIEETIKIMKEVQKAKDEQTIRDIAKKYKGQLSGDVLAMVLGFSKKGPEFLIAYDPAYYDENAERKFIDRVWENNRRCENIENKIKQ